MELKDAQPVEELDAIDQLGGVLGLLDSSAVFGPSEDGN